MPITLIVIRHGETKWNTERRMQGQTDIPLNLMGIKQAERMAKQLKMYPIQSFYSSPLKRAHRTARIIHALHDDAPLHLHDDLKERSFGVGEGMTYDEITRQFPVMAFDRSWDHPYAQIPEGERLIDVYRRGIRFMDELVENERGKTVAVIAHGVIIRCIISYLMDLPLNANMFYKLNNTSLTVIRLPRLGSPELHVLNHTLHLEKIED
ncbi:MAG: histidine phosphatase family protein [Candidatus Gottesmanbacteria bacterium]|nr:histidine phosphatase family protein [Candidatus Gottesmanbacteria bacterium]